MLKLYGAEQAVPVLFLIELVTLLSQAGFQFDDICLILLNGFPFGSFTGNF